MFPALWVSKTGLDAQEMQVNVISHNLANVNTTAFKKGRAIFQDLLYQKIHQPGGQSSQNTEMPSGLMLGTGVRIASTEKIFTQGSVLPTDNPLDVSINGRGYFQIVLPDGSTAYTRDGHFDLDKSGNIVTSGSGYQLQPSMTVPSGATGLTIGEDGTVSAIPVGSTSPTQLGTIQLYDFINNAGLEAKGENLYLETNSSGTAQASTPGLNGTGRLRQNELESSNVNVVEELVSLIETQRAYEMNAKAIETSDGMLRYISQNI